MAPERYAARSRREHCGGTHHQGNQDLNTESGAGIGIASVKVIRGTELLLEVTRDYPLDTVTGWHAFSYPQGGWTFRSCARPWSTRRL